MMLKRLTLSLLLAASLPAAPVDYLVTIDTSSLTGTGFLDIQFNPGSTPGQEPATASLSGFTMGTGSLDGAPVNLGGVSSNLPALILSLLADVNGTLQPVTWGDYINFTLTLAGTLVENPDPEGAIGALFSVSLLDSTGMDYLLGGPPSLSVEIPPAGGEIFISNNAPTGVITIGSVPEPSGLVLGVTGAALILLGRLKLRRP